MNLLDLKTPLSRLPREEVVLFIRELRYQRTLDHSPPKKEKKERKKKEPSAKSSDALLNILLKDPEQKRLFLEFLERQEGKQDGEREEGYTGDMPEM